MTVEALAAARTLQVWVADDDANDQILITLAAEEVGLDVDFRFLDSGSELLTALEEVNERVAGPDLIILDLRMPGLGGQRTLLELRGNDIAVEVPVIVFTTSTSDEQRLNALAAGAQAVEVKPLRFSGMVDFVLSLEKRSGREGRMWCRDLPAPAQSSSSDSEGSLFQQLSLRSAPQLLVEQLIGPSNWHVHP